MFRPRIIGHRQNIAAETVPTSSRPQAGSDFPCPRKCGQIPETTGREFFNDAIPNFTRAAAQTVKKKQIHRAMTVNLVKDFRPVVRMNGRHGFLELLSRLHPTQFQPQPLRGQPVLHVQFCEDVFCMFVNRPHTSAENHGDFGIGLRFGNPKRSSVSRGVSPCACAISGEMHVRSRIKPMTNSPTLDLPQ